MADMAEAFLRCGPLTARDGEGRRLFDEAVLEVFEECLTVLEGPSGSGKSTLLRHVAGLAGSSGAKRNLSGRNFGRRELPLWRSRVTLLAQGGPVLPGAVAENLEFPYKLCHADTRGFSTERARSLLDAADLGGIALDREVSSLSGGERHRLCLVRGLLWDPPVLLADEPLSGLDADVAAQCFSLIAEQARRPGRAVVCVLHDTVLGSQADRTIRVADGVVEVV